MLQVTDKSYNYCQLKIILRSNGNMLDLARNYIYIMLQVTNMNYGLELQYY